ncbi:MAG TPA: TonB-dependent receptor [Burkholderiales bacterium]
MTVRRRRLGTAAASLLAIGGICVAAETEPAPGEAAAPAPVRLPPIVITPTREAQSSFDVPASVDVLERAQIQTAQPQVNLSETLVRVPGIVAQNRQNYAQDLQISSRGFGARSTFGVRGVRLFVDGIPLTSPDGQGQAATADLGTAQRIEVLRGPFSALYGNSSGGVIAVFTEDPPLDPTFETDVGGGSYDTSKFGFAFGDTVGPFGFLGHVSRFATDGYRDHSAARRDQYNSKFTYDLGDGASLTFVATGLHQPDTQDPMGLTRAGAAADPRAAAPNAAIFNTRKSVRHDQQGLIYENRLGERASLRLLGYVGDRRVLQFLGFAGDAPLSSGGVVDLDREFGGVDARITYRGRLRDDPLTLTAGVAYDNQEERRRGFINDNGVAGELRRDEDDRVYNVDEYVQAEWLFAPRWRGILGVRHSRVRFTSDDHFVDPQNPDDSGSITFRSTNPVAGVIYQVRPNVNVYANAGRGFETPTFAELAYRPDQSPGLNFALQPSKSNNYEVGLKSFVDRDTWLNLALFYIDTENEIVVANNVGGRTTFQNAGRTERWGAEVTLATALPAGFSAYAALAYVDAEYAEPFETCVGQPVCTPTIVPAGNKIPGVPRTTVYGELMWRYPRHGFHTAIEARWSDRIFVNDLNSEAADRYTVVNWRAGFAQELGRLALAEFVRIDNLFDRRYIGSVIVNANNGRFYEPAPERNYFVGLQASYRF